jgi:hypothetical protein
MTSQTKTNVVAFESALKVCAAGGPKPLPIDGDYSLASIKADSHQWYCGGECPACRRTTPLFRDYTDGALGLKPFSGSGAVRFTCQFCEVVSKVGVSQLLTVRWP